MFLHFFHTCLGGRRATRPPYFDKKGARGNFFAARALTIPCVRVRAEALYPYMEKAERLSHRPAPALVPREQAFAAVERGDLGPVFVGERRL